MPFELLEIDDETRAMLVQVHDCIHGDPERFADGVRFLDEHYGEAAVRKRFQPRWNREAESIERDNPLPASPDDIQRHRAFHHEYARRAATTEEEYERECGKWTPERAKINLEAWRRSEIANAQRLRTEGKISEVTPYRRLEMALKDLLADAMPRLSANLSDLPHPLRTTKAQIIYLLAWLACDEEASNKPDVCEFCRLPWALEYGERRSFLYRDYFWVTTYHKKWMGLLERASTFFQPPRSGVTFLTPSDPSDPADRTSSGAEFSQLVPNERPQVRPLPDIDDSMWPNVTQAAKILSVSKGYIDSLVKKKQLRDNGKVERERRIDPGSILAYQQTGGARRKPTEAESEAAKQSVASARRLQWRCKDNTCNFMAPMEPDQTECPLCGGPVEPAERSVNVHHRQSK